MTLLHDRLAVTVMLFMALAGLWGLLLLRRRRGVEPATGASLAWARLLILAQGLLGVLLLIGGERPGRGIHILYGAVTALALPAPVWHHPRPR